LAQELLLRNDEPVSFDGEFYRLNDALLIPRSPRPGLQWLEVDDIDALEAMAHSVLPQVSGA
jgi:alkanesulfonate monooxygenase SsuD/methylene tetrahydromethanopterin reductase-like flavin-dependent oxidoreductase (luciferase family)